jgi:hypothetical protein
LVWTKKTVLKGELLIGRTKIKTRDQGTIQLKDSTCFKPVSIGTNSLYIYIQITGAGNYIYILVKD